MNGDKENQITWTVEGPDTENGHVRADDFIDEIEHLLSALNGIDKVVSETAQPTLYYRIVALSHTSPVSITIEPVIKPRVANPPSDYIAVRHHRFFRELEAIRRNDPVSEDIYDTLLEDFRDLAAGRGQSFRAASITNHEARVEIDETFEANVTKMLGEEYSSYGWVEGKLEALNIHGRARRVWLYPTVGPQRIRCDFEVDPPVAFKAREFRERLLNNRDGKTLPTPDAVHLATAVICKADAFITFDEGKKNKRHFGLLELNKDPRIDGLEICRPEFRKPPEPQRELFVAKQPDLPSQDQKPEN